jgi:hypothetical protein
MPNFPYPADLKAAYDELFKDFLVRSETARVRGEAAKYWEAEARKHGAEVDRLKRRLIVIHDLATWEDEDEPDEDVMIDRLTEIHQLSRTKEDT